MTDEALLAWIERGQVIATFLVAIGVAAEFVGTFMSRPIQQRIDRARELEIAQLRKQTEDERLARVKIEEKLAARRLSRQQISEVAATLRPFAGVRANFFAPSGDVEIVHIANDILLALTGPNGAGWIVTVSSGQQFGPTFRDRG